MVEKKRQSKKAMTGLGSAKGMRWEVEVEVDVEMMETIIIPTDCRHSRV